MVFTFGKNRKVITASLIIMVMFMKVLKPIYTFGTENKVHIFTNNLQGLQKVMVKDFS